MGGRGSRSMTAMTLNNKAGGGVGLVDRKTGQEVETRIERVSGRELKGYNKKSGWYVDWTKFGSDVELYKVTANGSDKPEGLMAMQDNPEGRYIHVLWIVAAPHNQGMVVKTNKKFDNVPGVLFAKAIDESHKKGYNGDIYGEAANPKLLDHYISNYGATPLGGKYSFFIGDDASDNIRRKFKWR